MKTHLSNFKVQRDPKHCLTVNSIYFTRIHTTFAKTPILRFFQTVYFLYASLVVVQILFPKVMSQFISFPRSCNSPRIAASNSSPKEAAAVAIPSIRNKVVVSKWCLFLKRFQLRKNACITLCNVVNDAWNICTTKSGATGI